jgi:hypothetical protein
MISANIFYNRRYRPLLLSALTVLIVLQSCGNKTNPLPPLKSPIKKPDKPVLMQKGDSIVVKIANPFAARNDDWKLKLFRLNKVLLPAQDDSKSEKSFKNTRDNKKSDEVSRSKADLPAAEKTPDIVIISSDEFKFRRSYPELPKINFEQFEESAIKIFELSGRNAGSAALAKEIKYIDSKKYDSRKMHPDVLYYAVNADDPENEYGSFGSISGIITLPIEEAPEISDWKVEKNSLILTIKPPSSVNVSGNTGSYFTGFNVYKGSCDVPQQTAVSNMPIAFVPENWAANSILRLIPLLKENNAENSGIGLVFSGRKEQELRQSLADEKSIKSVQNAVLHLKVEARCPGEAMSGAKIMLDDGRAGKLVEYNLKTGRDWNIFESDFTINANARKLDIIFRPVDEKYLSYYEIKLISLTVSRLTQETGGEKPSADKPAETQDKKTPDIKKSDKKPIEIKPGAELIKNGDFAVFPPLIIKDDRFSMEKEVCYSAVSTLKFADNYYESENGIQVKVFAKDIFPPEPVKGIYSLAKLDSITIFWQANKEPDLAGYNIYRKSEPDGVYTKINETPVKKTEYTDAPPLKNTKYIYYVVAVDKALAGNESKPSDVIEFIPRNDVLIEK